MTASIQQCVICYEELDRDLSAAPCGHVFHNVCIDRWHSHGSHCPMCHEDLPPKLLRLFFEPKQEAAQAPMHKSTGSVPGGTESVSHNGEGKHNQQGAPSDPEVTRLRRELASMTKLNSMSQEESTRLARRLAESLNEVLETKVTRYFVEEELQGRLKTAMAAFDAAKFDLFRIEEENSRLKRGMLEIQNQLRQSQGEKVALDFLLNKVSKMTGSRPHNGLGQVDVDQVLRLVAEGSAKAETVIKNQDELLSGANEREWRTKRELADNEAREVEFQELQVESKLECRRLSEALRKGWRDSLSDSPPMDSTKDYAQITESRRDWQVGDSFLPPRLVGEPRHGNIRGPKRPAPADVYADSTDLAEGTSRCFSAKRRASTVEGDNGIVSLGLDEKGGNEAEKEWSVFRECRDERDMCGLALARSNEAADAKHTGDNFSQLSRLGGHRGVDETFTRSGFDARSGRHNVLKTSNNRPGFRSTQHASAASPHEVLAGGLNAKGGTSGSTSYSCAS